MEKAVVHASNPKPQSGFTMTELVIGSAAFLVILTSAITMLTQWMKATGESDRAIEATDTGARAIAQIASDVRMATYLYHNATISISGNADAHNFGTVHMPVVTQGDPEGKAKAAFDPEVTRGGSDLIGINSTGARSVLAMISDQPYGISKPRYIIYWVDTTVNNRIVGNNSDYFLQPLYRLEASPSAANVDATPRGWYTFSDKITATSTSDLYINLGTKKLAENSLMNNAIDIGYRVSKVTDVVIGPVPTGAAATRPRIFTLRNPHPYSNASLMSPYLATISIRTTGVKANGYLKRQAEIFELNTQAFARNIPLPQNSEN